MGKFIVRATLVFVSVYFILSNIVAQIFGLDIIHNSYVLLFELCVVIYAYSEGTYHCKYIKHTALAILLSDTLTRLDNTFNFLSISAHNIIPTIILALSVIIPLTNALYHFYKINHIRHKHENTKRE